MQAKKFGQMVYENTDADYGICPPPTKAQDGLNILIEHFLGEDWYTVMPVCQEQVNTEAIYAILRKYPMSRDKKEKLREKLINIINKMLLK